MIVTDPAFSIYGLLERNYKVHYLVRHRSTMRLISQAIERAAADSGSIRLFSGFQRLSLFLPQFERYRTIAQHVDSIFVFGIPDVQPPPIENVTYIPLSPKDRMAHEWFVISYGRSYSSALSAQIVGDGTEPRPNSLFTGVWTFNPFIVSLLGDWLSSLVGVPPLTWEIDDYVHRQHVSNMTDMVKRMIEQIPIRERGPENDRLLILRQELSEALRSELNAEANDGAEPPPA